MILYDALSEVLKAWAFDCHVDSVYVTRGNVALVQAHLAKRGFKHIRVRQRSARHLSHIQ